MKPYFVYSHKAISGNFRFRDPFVSLKEAYEWAYTHFENAPGPTIVYLYQTTDYIKKRRRTIECYNPNLKVKLEFQGGPLPRSIKGVKVLRVPTVISASYDMGITVPNTPTDIAPIYHRDGWYLHRNGECWIEWKGKVYLTKAQEFARAFSKVDKKLVSMDQLKLLLELRKKSPELMTPEMEGVLQRMQLKIETRRYSAELRKSLRGAFRTWDRGSTQNI